MTAVGSTAVATMRLVGRSVWVGFLQGLAGEAGGDDAGGFGAGGEVVVWAVQRVGDRFLRGLGLAICSSRLASLRWARLRQLSTACVRDASSALDSRSENPTSRSNRITPTSPTADFG